MAGLGFMAAVPPFCAAWLGTLTLAGVEVGSSEPRKGAEALAVGKVAKLVEIKSLQFRRCVSRLRRFCARLLAQGARPLRAFPP